MTMRRTRRDFLKTSGLAGAGLWIGTRHAWARPASASEKLNVAIIGSGGQGDWNLHEFAKLGENIVALCDVHETREDVRNNREEFAKADFYTDFRKMLDRDDIDAVLIATPDHTHAPAALMAIRAGKHVYCEKPLCHSVAETRQVVTATRHHRVATQMGTQNHARGNYRRVVEVIKSGAIGPIREVHVWGRGDWSGGDRPKETPPTPEGLHYDLWLGPAPYRPYHPVYLPQKWRGWWDFGGGTLADMACHYLDLPKWALDLPAPLTVEAEGPPVHPESCPTRLTIRYTFPARGELPPVKLIWYSGSPRAHYFEDGTVGRPYREGCLFVGKKGMLMADYNRYALLPEEEFTDFKPPEPFIAESIGHHAEWIRACKGGEKALCNFEYAGELTETVLLGNVAYRSGKKLEWNARTAKVTNTRDADELLDPPHRQGWAL